MHQTQNTTTGSAAAAFMAKYGFHCPVYKATITPKGCEDNRKRPLAKDGAPGFDGDDRAFRRPGCGDDCDVFKKAPATWPRKAPETPAWALVKSITGCASYKELSDAIKTLYGKCNNNSVGRIFADLDRGNRPKGSTWEALLRFTKLSADQLLHPAQSMQQLAAAAPAASVVIEPMPGQAPAVIIPTRPQAQFDPNTGQVEPLDAMPAAAELSSYDAVPTLMGADPAEQLFTAQELSEFKAAIPADFVPYDETKRPEPAPRPALITFDKRGITISAGAVRQYGLEGVERVRLLYSAQRGQLAIQPGYDGPGSRKMIPTKRGLTRQVYANAVLRQFGVRPVMHTHLLTKAPSGLLVATISEPAQPGKEA